MRKRLFSASPSALESVLSLLASFAESSLCRNCHQHYLQLWRVPPCHHYMLPWRALPCQCFPLLWRTLHHLPQQITATAHLLLHHHYSPTFWKVCQWQGLCIITSTPCYSTSCWPTNLLVFGYRPPWLL